MTVQQALDELAGRFGILAEFEDLAGQRQRIRRETQLALLRANGLQLDNDAMILAQLAELQQIESRRKYPREIIVTASRAAGLDLSPEAEWRLQLDGEQDIRLEGRTGPLFTLPPLPSGVHRLTVGSGADSETIRLIAAPQRAPLLEDVTGRSRIWGVNTALYGLHSARTAGIGDFADLTAAVAGTGAMGASFLGINPVHNIGWMEHDTISPYSPSHRGFLNTAHIAADRICGLERSGAARAVGEQLRQAFARSSARDFIDYQRHYQTHGGALSALYEIFLREADNSAKQEFDEYCREQGEPLQKFALFEALSERHGPDWRDWPRSLQTMGAGETAVPGPADESKRFHSWLQWVATSQLAAAQRQARGGGMALGLYLDLAVGPRRGAAETWCEQAIVAEGVSIGAPPDFLSPAGQKWDLAGFAPAKLAETGYQAFRDILAQTMRHCGVLRIDHVLGMNRSYWIPDDGSPGGYIRQPFQSLLAMVAIEAERAGTVIVGEDLGLVPDGFRETMRAHGLYSYSVLQYEKTADGAIAGPDQLRPASLACFGTHDTPTLKGFYHGHDIDWWQKLNWIDADGALQARANRQNEIAGICAWQQASGETDSDARSFDHLNICVHSALANSDVAMVSVQLDDVFGEMEAQNLPGTINEHPNWRRRCQIPVEAFDHNENLLKIAGLMHQGARNAPDVKRENSSDH